jgi:hypothetical protein
VAAPAGETSPALSPAPANPERTMPTVTVTNIFFM